MRLEWQADHRGLLQWIRVQNFDLDNSEKILSKKVTWFDLYCTVFKNHFGFIVENGFQEAKNGDGEKNWEATAESKQGIMVAYSRTWVMTMDKNRYIRNCCQRGGKRISCYTRYVDVSSGRGSSMMTDQGLVYLDQTQDMGNLKGGANLGGESSPEFCFGPF